MRKKGGSVASNAVSGLVTDGAYNALSKNFSNQMNSGKCGGRKHIRGGNAGNVFTTVSNAFVNGLGLGGTKEGFNVFRSSPAPANAAYAGLRGNANVRSGGKMQARNISNYMNNASDYNVRHKRGGADNMMNGLDYSIIPSTSKLVGNATASRTISDDVLQLKSTDNVAASPALIKDAHYGSVKDGVQLFNYAGIDKIVGGKKKKPAVKKPVAKKPVAKKPVAKKTKKPKAKKPKKN